MGGDKAKLGAKIKIEKVEEYRKDENGNKYLSRVWEDQKWKAIKKEES